MTDDAPCLVVLVNNDVGMTRGKYAAQAVHAALFAIGVHPKCPVVVLNATTAEVAKCHVQVRDAGCTELTPGTLTAGAFMPDLFHARTPADGPGVTTDQPVEPVAAHLPTVKMTRAGTYIAECSCGRYQTRPQSTVAPVVEHIYRHILGRENEASYAAPGTGG
jgi:peptidyl-tRNA hydrolase, PTH2 family